MDSRNILIETLSEGIVSRIKGLISKFTGSVNKNSMKNRIERAKLADASRKPEVPSPYKPQINNTPKPTTHVDQPETSTKSNSEHDDRVAQFKARAARADKIEKLNKIDKWNGGKNIDPAVEREQKHRQLLDKWKSKQLSRKSNTDTKSAVTKPVESPQVKKTSKRGVGKPGMVAAATKKLNIEPSTETPVKEKKSRVSKAKSVHIDVEPSTEKSKTVKTKAPKKVKVAEPDKQLEPVKTIETPKTVTTVKVEKKVHKKLSSNVPTSKPVERISGTLSKPKQEPNNENKTPLKPILSKQTPLNSLENRLEKMRAANQRLKDKANKIQQLKNEFNK